MKTGEFRRLVVIEIFGKLIAARSLLSIPKCSLIALGNSISLSYEKSSESCMIFLVMAGNCDLIAYLLT